MFIMSYSDLSYRHIRNVIANNDVPIMPITIPDMLVPRTYPLFLAEKPNTVDKIGRVTKTISPVSVKE